MGTISLTQTGVLHQHQTANTGLRYHIFSILSYLSTQLCFSAISYYVPVTCSYYILPTLPTKTIIQLQSSLHSLCLPHTCHLPSIMLFKFTTVNKKFRGRKYILPTFLQANITFLVQKVLLPIHFLSIWILCSRAQKTHHRFHFFHIIHILKTFRYISAPCQLEQVHRSTSESAT